MNGKIIRRSIPALNVSATIRTVKCCLMLGSERARRRALNAVCVYWRDELTSCGLRGGTSVGLLTGDESVNERTRNM